MTDRITGQQRRRERRLERLDWLRDHPSILASLPIDRGVLSDAQQAMLQAVIEMMKTDKLYATHASPADTRWSVRRLVAELRGRP